MTLYVLFEELEAGRLSLNSRMKVSRYASKRPPTKLGMKPGSTLKVKDAILGLVTKSANDAATVIAENISGSESKFAKRMTRTARSLGMSKTTFRNPHGLPNSGQKTTARDMARLGRAIQERFPKYYKYFKTRAFSYKGRRHGNHNKLLGRVRGVDGIKTGYTRASGFNLVTSVKRGNRHIIAVVLGGRTGRSRDAQMVKLINGYLKRASKGPKTSTVIAKRRQTKRISLAMKNAPVPDTKPGTRAGGQLIVAQAKPSAREVVDLPTGSIPVPPKPVQASMVTTIPVKIQKQDHSNTTSTVATNDTPDQEPGWQVQIAAADSENRALEMLKKAKTVVGDPLNRQVPYTEPVNTNGQTLYRARFIGFETKTAALNACKSLKRAKFACYAIYQ